MSKFDDALDWIGHKIADRLTDESGYEPYTPSSPETLRAALRPGDVLLVEGSQKVSTAVKYLTQSTWSHAALYIGENLPENLDSRSTDQSASDIVEREPRDLIEVNLGEGCVAVPLSKYASFNTRICRPVGLMGADRQRVVHYMIDHLGTNYDMRNILDMLRYFFPTPPVPARWRRKMIALGSGEPTRAICSTLIAQAFQQVRYPILPRIERVDTEQGGVSRGEQLEDGSVRNLLESGRQRRSEIFHIRHHSLFAPCDFDLSPYFGIIKPTIERGFDYKSLDWAEESADEAPDGEAVDEPLVLAGR